MRPWESVLSQKDADCHSQCAHWLRNDRVTGSTVTRDDVGSELSAASGGGSEVSEGLRSKVHASAVRQRRNFGHRNRDIVPYGMVCRGGQGRPSLQGIFVGRGDYIPPLWCVVRGAVRASCVNHGASVDIFWYL